MHFLHERGGSYETLPGGLRKWLICKTCRSWFSRGRERRDCVHLCGFVFMNNMNDLAVVFPLVDSAFDDEKMFTVQRLKLASMMIYSGCSLYLRNLDLSQRL